MSDTPFDASLQWFRQALPYINAHRGKTFVIHLDGAVLQSPNLHVLMTDITLLNSLGIRLVISYGIRPQLQALFAARNLPWQEYQGRLILQPQTLDTLIECVTSLRLQLEACFSAGHAQGASLKVFSGNLITARPMGVRDGQDLHYTGELRKIAVSSIRQLLDLQGLVLLPPLGYSSTGEVFDLSAEEVAKAAAIHLKADKLLFLSDDQGLMNDEGQRVRDLTPAEARKWLAETASNNQQLYLQAACSACEQGVPRAHLISYQRDGALLKELFTLEGDGTMITQQHYETLRQATIDDVGGLLALLRPLEETGVLVRRSRELLEAEIERFTVIDLDGHLIGCAALYPYPEQQQAELACVVVSQDYRREKRGDWLLAALEKQARKQGITSLFVLTTQTAHWFLERGFVPASRDQLPAAKRDLYNWQRNSKVFCKPL